MKKKLQIFYIVAFSMVSVAMLFIFDYWLFDMSAFFKGEWQEVWFSVLGFIVFIAGLFYTAFCVVALSEDIKKLQ